jgi:betaine-aldehyde dehydrogenase
MQHTQLYINGAHQSATSNETFTSINPATGLPLTTIDQASQADVDAAVASSQAGFAIWSAMMPVERARILQKAAQILRERNDELAQLEVLDTGKPLQEANCVDITSGADVIEYYAGLISGMQGTQQDLGKDAFFMSRREPLGVCAGIGAWNYPIQIACWKSGPCLAAGNAMVFKPSEETPLSVMKLAEIYTEAGLPDGVFNVVQGDYRVGQMLTAHKHIAKVSFTGESGTGKKIMADSASNLKQVTMELGGKSPMLVFDDAKLDNAVAGAMLANFYTQGEVCTNGTRVFVQAGVYDEFVAKVVARANTIKLGDPLDLDTQMGALISEKHLEKVLGYIEGAKKTKARLVCGGKRHNSAATKNGYFVEPTVFADCTDDMVHVQEEIFGPVMSILKFTDEDEAIARANDSDYGLAAGVFSQDISRAHRVINQMQAGICWINSWGDSPAEMPVGGYKQSGIGRENGPETLHHYTQVKSVFVRLDDLESPY